MGVYGGLGAGKGWLQFRCLVEPDLLSEALQNIGSLRIIENGRVAFDYSETPIEEFIDRYTKYLIASFAAGDWKETEFSARLIDRDVLLKESPCPDTRYKLIELDEPVISVRPGMVYYDAKRGKLSTNTHSSTLLGLEFNYPRVYSLRNEQHELLHDTAGLPTFQAFQRLTEFLSARTCPCRIRSESREHRTPIRITDLMREQAHSHKGLLTNGLSVV
jgi:hypothetical protein